MPAWVLPVATLAAYFFLLVVLPFVPTELRNDRIEEITKARDTGVLAVGVLFFLSFVSYPVGLLHNWWSRGGRKATDKWRIDAWIIAWLISNFVILLFLLPKYPLLVIFPIARLSDLMYVLVRLFLLTNAVFKRGRALLFLLVHYLEVVAIFGCFYIFLQQMSGARIFIIGNQPDFISPAQAFYFSFTTAATVGFGDITPNLRVEPLWARPSDFVALELLCIVIIVALDVAHIFSKPEAAAN